MMQQKKNDVDNTVMTTINEVDLPMPTEDILSFRLSPQTMLEKDEFIVAMFENEGFCPGQVISDKGENVEGIFMQKVGNGDKSLWKWPSSTDKQLVRKMCILKIRPNLDVNITLSTRRCLIYKLLNLELVQKFD